MHQRTRGGCTRGFLEKWNTSTHFKSLNAKSMPSRTCYSYKDTQILQDHHLPRNAILSYQKNSVRTGWIQKRPNSEAKQIEILKSSIHHHTSRRNVIQSDSKGHVVVCGSWLFRDLAREQVVKNAFGYPQIPDAERRSANIWFRFV